MISYSIKFVVCHSAVVNVLVGCLLSSLLEPAGGVLSGTGQMAKQELEERRAADKLHTPRSFLVTTPEQSWSSRKDLQQREFKSH